MTQEGNKFIVAAGGGAGLRRDLILYSPPWVDTRGLERKTETERMVLLDIQCVLSCEKVLETSF